jgi:hypothetical protein
MTADAANTAEIEARRTAEAAQIIVVQFTAEQDRRNYDMTLFTVTAEAVQLAQDAMTQQAGVYTATAYATSVPATQTQQARQSASYETAVAMTINAPTQIVAMARAATVAQYTDAMAQVDLLVRISVSVLLMALAATAVIVALAKVKITPVAVTAPDDYTPIPEPTAEQQTVLHIRTDHGGGYARTERTVVPCSPGQFGKLVSGVLNEGRSLAYNVWEGADEPFTRDQFTLVRNWLLSNRLAQSVGQGALILSAAGESLFIDWVNNQALPESYKFIEVV